MERIQTEGSSAIPLPSAASEVRLQSQQLLAVPQQSFGERLDMAVNAATEALLAVAADPGTPSRITGDSVPKAGGSMDKNVAMPVTLLVKWDTAALADASTTQPPALDVEATPATCTGLNDPPQEPAFAKPDKPLPDPCSTVVSSATDSHGVLIAKPAPSLAREMPVSTEKIVVTEGARKGATKKTVQNDKAESAHVEVSSIAPDRTLEMRVESVLAPANVIPAPMVGTVANQPSALAAKTEPANVHTRKELVSLLAGASHSPGTTETGQSPPARPVGFEQDLKSRLSPDSMPGSVATKDGVQVAQGIELPAAIQVGLQERASSGVPCSTPVAPYEFEKILAPNAFTPMLQGAEALSVQPGHNRELGTATSNDPGQVAPVSGILTTNSLEIGMSHGTHGWLKVRADLENGAVTASLSSGTAAGREMLHRELPALSDFLRQEKLDITAVVVKDTGTSLSAGLGGGGDAQPQERSTFSNSSGQPDTMNEWDSLQLRETEMPRDEPVVVETRSQLLSTILVSKGGWLNVRV